jgi:hypothetical protein
VAGVFDRFARAIRPYQEEKFASLARDSTTDARGA